MRLTALDDTRMPPVTWWLAFQLSSAAGDQLHLHINTRPTNYCHFFAPIIFDINWKQFVIYKKKCCKSVDLFFDSHFATIVLLIYRLILCYRHPRLHANNQCVLNFFRSIIRGLAVDISMRPDCISSLDRLHLSPITVWSISYRETIPGDGAHHYMGTSQFPVIVHVTIREHHNSLWWCTSLYGCITIRVHHYSWWRCTSLYTGTSLFQWHCTSL